MDFPTSVELDRLRAVGTVHLPRLADDIGAATNGLRDVGDPSDAFRGGLFQNSKQKWIDACRDLENILWYTEDALRDAATSIIQVADNYAWVDSEAAIHLDEVDGY